MTPTPDDQLRQLPAHDVDPARAEQLRRRAHAILLARARVSKSSIWAGYYHRFVEPAALLALGLGFLLSSVQATMALFE